MNHLSTFPSRPVVHRCAVCNRPLAGRMRVCPYCGEDVPVRYPFGLPRFAPCCACLAVLLTGCVFCLADGRFPGLLSSHVANRLHSPASIALACMGLILLFLPPSVAEPGAPLYTPRQRVFREAFWRLLYLLASILSASLAALSAGMSAWWVLALSLFSTVLLVFSVPFHALPVWTYPVAPLFLAAALV